MPQACKDDTTGTICDTPGADGGDKQINIHCDDHWVTIIGAGITGLTAAHELVERGFRVQVIEKANSSPMDIRRRVNGVGCAAPTGETVENAVEWAKTRVDVGGVARNQWSLLHDICKDDEKTCDESGMCSLGTWEDFFGRLSFQEGLARVNGVLTADDLSPTMTSGVETQDDLLALLTKMLSSGKANLQNVIQKILADLPDNNVNPNIFQNLPKNQPLSTNTGLQRLLSLGRAPEIPIDAAGAVNERLFVIPFELSDGVEQVPKSEHKALLAEWLTPWKEQLENGTALVRRVLIRYRLPDGSEWPANDAISGRMKALDFIAPTLGASLPDVVREIFISQDQAQQIFAGAALERILNAPLVAGEHGYRFFAGFYRHLRDTMKRTPIYDPARCEFTDKTVHDNLVEVKWQAIADPQRAYATAFPRKPVHSITELRNVYQRIRRDLGYRPSDILRFMLRILRYMTSSSERRAAHYEDLTWWDFLSIRNLRRELPRPTPPPQPTTPPQRFNYGQRFAEALKHSPQALVAMKADLADARTQGNISVQLLMDNLGLHEFSDSTLTGPTSEAWFVHWRKYLEAQGVRFYSAEVKKVTYRAGAALGHRLDLKFDSDVLMRLEGEEYKKPSDTTNSPHYVICATDLPGAADLFRDTGLNIGVLAGEPEPEVTEEDTEPGAGLGAEPLEKFAYPDGRYQEDPRILSLDMNKGHDRYQTLTGIQFFYPSRLSFADAHIYYAESAWGLSAVSQYQYWRPYVTQPQKERRFLGNLSIDIGAWGLAGGYNSPSSMSADEIANAVQDQIISCLGTVGGRHAPRARYYHLDDLIEFDNDGKPFKNHYPYLINLVSDWKHRPLGALWSPLDGEHRNRVPGRSALQPDADVWHQGGYLVHHGQLVFAGTYMRTYTRLGTMESANESARHAVNAILDHCFRHKDEGGKSVPKPPWDRASKVEPHYLWTPLGDYCSIWDPEQSEIPDLEFAKLVDKYLFAKKPPKEVEAEYLDDRPPGNNSTYFEDRPHMFDLLGIDELPNLIDDDADALRVFDVLNAGLQALSEDDSLDDTNIARALLRIRKGLVKTFGL